MGKNELKRLSYQLRLDRRPGRRRPPRPRPASSARSSCSAAASPTSLIPTGDASSITTAPFNFETRPELQGVPATSRRPFAGESQNFDANGPYLRFQSGGGSARRLAELRQPQPSGGGSERQPLRQHAAPASIGTQPAFGAKPPFTTDVACQTERRPRRSTGPGSASVPRARRPSHEPSAQRTPTRLPGDHRPGCRRRGHGLRDPRQPVHGPAVLGPDPGRGALRAQGPVSARRRRSRPARARPWTIAGIQVGDITEAELENGQAIVTMEVDNDKAHLIKEDASLLLRPKTGLNDMVHRGRSRHRGGGHRGGEPRFPLASTQPNVNPDEVLASLDADTQAFLKLLLAGGAEGLDPEKGRDGKLSQHAAPVRAASPATSPASTTASRAPREHHAARSTTSAS